MDAASTSASTSAGDPGRARAVVRVGGIAGVLAPLLFLGVIFVEGWLRPGYDWVSMYASALALGPRGFVQITNFLVTGTLLPVFARGVAAELGAREPAGAAMLAVMGLCLFPAGLFTMDPIVGSPADSTWGAMTLHSQLHYGFSALFFSLAPASCFVFFRRFGKEHEWASLRWPTLAVAIGVVVGIVLLKAAMAAGPFTAWLGLLQRAILLAWFGWVLAFGVALFRRDQREVLRYT